MSVFTYTATREIAPGNVAQASTTRNFRLVSWPKTRRPMTRQNTALAGAVESLLLRSEKHYNCTTGLIDPESLTEAYVEEFLASVENGEGFTFDRYGTIAEPDNPVGCIMVSKSFPTTEQGKKYHRYRFVIRES